MTFKNRKTMCEKRPGCSCFDGTMDCMTPGNHGWAGSMTHGCNWTGPKITKKPGYVAADNQSVCCSHEGQWGPQRHSIPAKVSLD